MKYEDINWQEIPSFYVRKIADLRTGETGLKKNKMCGQTARASVLSEKAVDILENKNISQERKDEQLCAMNHFDVWEPMKKFEPKLGYPVYFTSLRLGAGWFRSSLVEKVEQRADGVFIMTTCNSVYEIIPDEDD